MNGLHLKMGLVEGHAGRLVFGRCAGLSVAILAGRLHYYEGYTQDQTTFPIRILSLLGLQLLILTNAAGGVNSTYRKGDIMILRDHLCLPGMAGLHPLVGPMIDWSSLREVFPGALESKFLKPPSREQSPRFPSLNQCYPIRWQRMLAQVALECGMERSAIHSGNYAYLSGPSYETPLEIEVLRQWNVDAVGMSTIPEAVVASQMNIPVLAFSLISNEIAPSSRIDPEVWLWNEENGTHHSDHSSPYSSKATNGTNGVNGMNGTNGLHSHAETVGPTHAEVIEAVAARAKDLVRILHGFILRVAPELASDSVH